jgi:tetratricopeptide (TPR) repeat protein
VADIFISYTSADRDWAFWIAKALEALGHKPHVHEWEIERGGDIYAWMEGRHDAADHVLCVVSDEYLKAPYSTLERNAALWQAAAKRPGFVLFVAVKPSRLPTLSDHIRRCELFGIPEDAARMRFREFMEKRAAPETVAFPGKTFAVSNIPIRVPAHFLGRDESLAAIEAALNRYEGRVAITTLEGMRGVGKTTLAAAYAETHRGAYRATWWIRAQAGSSMRADLAALGVRLGWVAADDKEEPALAVIMERLRNEGEGVLLIFDNAIDSETIKPYLPRGGACRILVTSNAHAWRDIAEPVEVRLWPKAIGADYLIVRTGREVERAVAEALSEALGGLPLAHEQAAAYCERLDISLAEYRRRFEAAPARLLDDRRHAPAEYHDGLTVAKTFGLAIEEAGKLHPAAEPLIVHAALLAPEPIPLYLFSEGRKELGWRLSMKLAGEGLNEAIAALRAFALVNREAIADERDPSISTDTIRLHRLVREVAAGRRSGKAIADVQRALVEALAVVHPGEEAFHDPKTWPRARRLDGLAMTLVGVDKPVKGIERPVMTLLNGLAGYRLSALAASAQARPLLERALEISEKALGPQHPVTAAWLNNLANAVPNRSARPLHERALAIREKAFGPKHPMTAKSLANLAFNLRGQGDLAGARRLAERALAICEKALGPEHPQTADCLKGLAEVLHLQDDPGARSLFERALAIREKALGPGHDLTGVSLFNLANWLRQRGDLASARPLYERALAIAEKMIGPEHPGVATVLHQLSGLLQRQGDLAGAQLLSERALAIREKSLGPEHRDTAASLGAVAYLKARGDLPGALSLSERALAICEKVLGPEHPDTAASLNNLAVLMSKSGRNQDAEPLFGRAISISEKILGFADPLTQRYRSHCARLFLDSGRPAEALAFAEAALAIHAANSGSNDSWTEYSAVVTADALDALGRAEEAAALRERYGSRLDDRPKE